MAYGDVGAGGEARGVQDPFAEFGRARSGRAERDGVSGQVGHRAHGRVGADDELEVGLVHPADRAQGHRVREEAGALGRLRGVGEDQCEVGVAVAEQFDVGEAARGGTDAAAQAGIRRLEFRRDEAAESLVERRGLTGREAQDTARSGTLP